MNSRAERAMQLDPRTWKAGPDYVEIPSRTRPGMTHRTTLDTCTCEDKRKNPEIFCLHMIAARMFYFRQGP